MMNKKEKIRRFYNCHVHAFTMDHVPNQFFSKVFTVSGLLSKKWLKKIIKNAPLTGNFGIVGNLLVSFFAIFFGFEKKIAIRYITLVKYGDSDSQKKVINQLKSYYPVETGFAVLTMDMEYMGAGAPKERFEVQVRKLATIKNESFYNNLIYPFIFADPRRIQPKHYRETTINNNFTGTTFLEIFKQQLSSKNYQGIKIYPALGYFPFDERMKEVYDFALEHNVPIMTHCTVGVVHLRYWPDAKERKHPVLGITFPKEKPSEFQKNYTHPLNYECLLNKNLLKKAWQQDEVPDYKNLKICIGHWGSEEEWHNYLDNPWLEIGEDIDTSTEYPSLSMKNWHINEKKHLNYSWFTIICDLIRKYNNVYADISYTLNDTSLLPLLKMILEADEKIRSRVIFGTDFYVVSKAMSERAYSINIRSYLGPALFEQIAIENAEQYLSNHFGEIKNIGESLG